MKIKGLFTLTFFSAISFLPSCIQDEPLNAEADILKCYVNDSIKKAEPQIGNDKVTILTKRTTDLSKIAPKFDLTSGATLTPKSGTVLDFTKPQIYTVTSQDGKWSKEYLVSFNTESLPTTYRFEHWKLDGSDKYHVFYESVVGEEMNIWASGNPAFAIMAGKRPPEEYPTSSCDEGVHGKGLRLETLTTGSFGIGVGMPIAAGNLFLGTFNTAISMARPLEATQFGLPFEKNPIKMEGNYKYTAGPTFTNKKNEVVPNKKDMADIYAVFYETDGDLVTLDGANVLTSENIVSMARIENPKESSEYISFSVPFVLMPGKTIDLDKLKANKYNLAVVLSSSREGAYFCGSVGSLLYVDEIKIITE